MGGHQDSALRILDVALGAAEGDCKVRLATHSLRLHAVHFRCCTGGG